MNLTRHKYSHGTYCNGNVIYLAFIYSRSCYHAVVCDYLIQAIFLPRKIFNINLASSLSSSSFYPAQGHKPSTNSCQVFVTLVLLQPHPCPPNVIHLCLRFSSPCIFRCPSISVALWVPEMDFLVIFCLVHFLSTTSTFSSPL